MNPVRAISTLYPGLPAGTRLFSAILLLSLLANPLMGAERQRIPLEKGQVLTLPASVESIAAGNADIAEVQKLDATHLYILGKRVGSTNVVLCGHNDCFRTIEIEVTYDLESLKAKLHEIFPDELPEIHSSQGSIILSGQVSSVEKMNGILAVAATFLPDPAGSQKSPMPATGNLATGGGPGAAPAAPASHGHGLVNLMQVGGPQQVMLGVTVAEISRSLARNLKVDFSAFGGGGDVTGGAIGAGSVIQSLKQAVSATNPASLFFSFVGRDATVQTVIHAARDNGLVKILAEPNLTTISGQDAEFVSGGEFPIPVPQFGAQSGTGGGITVQFKEYGVILKFLPVVLNSGRVSMKINIAVSEIDPTNNLKLPVGDTTSTFVIPSLTKRNAASSMELDDGQTLGIAGLISDRLRENISKFPGLGDIPLLGQLFTSQQFLKNETELMIFVTPHLVKPVDPAKIRLPTDTFIEPDDEDFYLKGRSEGTAVPPAPTLRDPTRFGGGLRGHFGQQL